MNASRAGRLFVVLAIVFLLTTYILLTVSYVTLPGKLEGADFLTYYSVGKVAREDGLDRVYDLDLEAAAQARTAGVPPGSQQVLPPNHPPFLYPYLDLLAGLAYRPAYFGYALLLLLLVAAGLPVVYRGLIHQAWPAGAAWLALIGVLLFEPFFFSLLKGQDSALLLLGGLLWFGGLLLEDDRLAGLGLSLTLIRPQITLLLAVPFLFRRRKVFAWFCAGAAALGLYSFLLVGVTGVRDYWHILTISTAGQGYGMAEGAMFNLTGLLVRFFPGLDLNLIHGIGWGTFAAALLGLCILWACSRKIGLLQLSLAVVLALFFVPHLHYHDLVLLAVPLLGGLVAAVRIGRWPAFQAAGLLLAVSMALLLAEWWDPARFSLPYLLMILLPLFTWRMVRTHEAA